MRWSGLADEGHKVGGQGTLGTPQMSINRGIDTYTAVQSHIAENDTSVKTKAQQPPAFKGA